MPRSSPTLALAIVAIVGLIGSAAALQRVRDDRYPRSPVSEETLYVTSGTTLKRLTVGYNALAADLYWIRTIQYYGSTKQRLATAPGARGPRDAAEAYKLLYPLLDHTTTLDPLFNIAYRFGAIFLAEPFPGGAGRPDLAMALLQKGLTHRPDKWEYMWDIGFVHYWWKHDYPAAASWFQKASQVPGAPIWMQSLAATTLIQGGDRQQSRAMWETIRQNAEVDWLRNDAERRLLQLDALDFIDLLQPAVDRATKALGRVPEGWGPMIRAGLIRGEPRDATDTPFEIDGSGRVRLSPRSGLYPLPDEPKRIAGPVPPLQ